MSHTGASGAELANIVNEAALRAVRENRRYVTQSDLEESIEVVIAGYQKKNAILTDQEKKVVSYHEIGHALVAAKQTNSAPVQKITIVPRTSGALGYTMQVEEGNLDKQEKSIGVYNSKHQQEYKTALGGPQLASYGTKYVTLLMHWNNSPRESKGSHDSI